MSLWQKGPLPTTLPRTVQSWRDRRSVRSPRADRQWSAFRVVLVKERCGLKHRRRRAGSRMTLGEILWRFVVIRFLL